MSEAWREARLGGDTQVHHVDGLEAMAAAHAHLAAEARRSLALFSRDMDPRVLDRPEFLDAVRRLATSSRYASIRVLVMDPTPAVKSDHRLIALSQRLTTFIEIRVVAQDYQDRPEAFLVADDRAYVHRNAGDRFEGELCMNAPLHCREMLRFFDEVWEVSESDAQLRRLHI